jgi:hypothetical protein
MNDETKHVNPSAPRTLSDKPYPVDPRAPVKWTVEKITRIKKMGDISLASPLEARIVEKLEEVIDRINKMNEL